MQDAHVDALRAFLDRSVPDVEVWAPRRGAVLPELLALSARHLYRITASEVEGRPAFGFDRWPYEDISVSLVEWSDPDGYRRRWTLRMRDAALTLDTDEGSPVEALMRVLVERAVR